MIFDYGTLVRIKQGAPDEFRPGAIASVCGITVASAITGKTFQVPVGTVMYLVEFTDGNAVDIPGHFLEEGASPNQSK